MMHPEGPHHDDNDIEEILRVAGVVAADTGIPFGVLCNVITKLVEVEQRKAEAARTFEGLIKTVSDTGQSASNSPPPLGES